MRIYMKDEEQRHGFWLLLPSLLIFNHLTVSIVWLVLRARRKRPGDGKEKKQRKFPFGGTGAPVFSASPTFPQLMRLVNVYWRMRFRHPGWILVDARSADGSAMKVKL